jgi:virulence factor Mce-like protein
MADGLVGAVRYGHRHKTWLSAGALALTLLVGLSYLTLGALRWNPLASVYRVTVELPASGGLLPNQDVTLRGVPIGKVEKLLITPAGVNAEIRLDSAVKLSESSKARVSGLSAAGEQYIDFDGGDGRSPFMAEGSDVALGRTAVPVTMADLLAHSDGMLKQIDTDKLNLIKKELSLSKDGPQKLSDIVEGGTFLLSALDGVLPQTTSLLNTTRVALQLVADKNEGMTVAAANLDEVFGGVSQMTGGFRVLTEQAPKSLAEIDTLIADNSDTMVSLLGDLTTLSELLYLRVPALNALFPSHRGSVLDSFSGILHDNGFWLTVDFYPRYSCDYGTPRRPPSTAHYPEPFMYTYCLDDDPAVLIRGAKNAPRPAGDDTAGPPPGADLGRQTDPEPQGRYSVQTPYGGPILPVEPPS